MLRGGGVVGPLGTLTVVGVVVVDHVQQHGNAPPVAFAHEVLELVTPTDRMFHCHEVRGAVTPISRALGLRNGHHLDAVDAEVRQIVQQLDGVFDQPTRRPRPTPRPSMCSS